jgi:quercetin dioxygenase-like cupin family protein
MPEKPIIRHFDEVEPQAVTRSRAAVIQVMLGPDDGLPNFYTRRFTIEPGGEIPLHRHDRLEHEQVVIAGSMKLVLDGQEHFVKTGDCIYIPAGVAHAYSNPGEQAVQFLCMVPALEDYQTEWII